MGEDEGPRVVHHARRVQCRLDQQLVHQAPGHVVADGHLGVDDEPVFARRLAEVHRMRRHDERVGDGHHLVLRRTDAGHQRRLLHHVARRFVQLDAVAQFEGAHVGDDQPRDDVADNRTRSERDNQTHEHRNALEHTRIGTRQVRINHRHHEGVEQEADDVVGGHRPVGVEAVQLEPLGLHLARQVAEQAYQVLDGKADDEDGEEIGDVGQNTVEDALHGVPDVEEKLVGQVLGLREDGKQHGHRQQQLQQHEGVAEQVGDEHQQLDLLLRVQQLKVLDGEGLQARVPQPQDAHLQLTEKPVGKLEQQELTHKHQHKIGNALKQLLQAVFLLHHLQLLHDDRALGGGQLVARATLPQTVLVGKGDNDLVPVHHVGYDVRAFDID